MASRILLYGVTGSGKSTAAGQVGAALGLPVTLVDELMWQPGWVPTPDAEQRALIGRIVAGDAWVLDSAYGLWLDLVLTRTELIIGLDYSRWLSLQRLVRRTVSRLVHRTVACNGNVETLRQVLSSDSILRWHFSSFARKRARMREWAAHDDRVVLFGHPRQLEAWISALPGGR